jgi:hypothetical protein
MLSDFIVRSVLLSPAEGLETGSPSGANSQPLGLCHKHQTCRPNETFGYPLLWNFEQREAMIVRVLRS